MAGLDPAIYLIENNTLMAADARIKSGHDESLLVNAGNYITLAAAAASTSHSNALKPQISSAHIPGERR